MISEVPDSIKQNKNIGPFIQRSNELEEVNPIVSYYCKIYVLEYILNNKLHKESKENEVFTITLLDLTESFKNEGDEATIKVLEDKNLSVSMLMGFTLKIFNSCLTELNAYQISKKPQLVSKFRVCLNFFKLFELFKNEASIDYSKLTNGKYHSYGEFNGDFIKNHNKILKFNLSKIIKDEVEVQDQEADEEELERELAKLSANDNFIDNDVTGDVEMEGSDDVGNDIGLPQAPQSDPQHTQDSSPKLPSTPSFIDDKPADLVSLEPDESDFKLPGVPHFSPETENDDIKLPGAPKYLPDDDISTINKTNSIQIFTPEEETPKKTQSAKPQAKPKPKHVVHQQHHDITKQNIESILDKQESITKVQKHCKFAVSALNYEDLQTAEDELLKGLELLKLLKQQENTVST